MDNVPYVKVEIEESYLVWFQNSNQYFQLEEPAWFVFERLAKMQEPESVANELSQHFGFSFEESLSFSKDMLQRINDMNQPIEQEMTSKKDLNGIDKFKVEPYSTYNYQLGAKYIKFSYGVDWLEDYIHSLISHLNTSAKVEKIPLFELFYYQGRVCFRINNEMKGNWGVDESHLVKGRIFLELINLLHGKTDDDWMMTVHASAITNSRKTILFSAAPGRGKTTMAALLQAQGYHLISDDFVPFDRDSPNAYPFPAAMSVKEGSVELLTSLYPGLKDKPLNYVSPEKNVRYLPIENEMMNMIYPAHEIIFIKYDKAADFELKKLEPIKAFAPLLEQIWVPPSPSNVKLLFERLSEFSFYELTYSDNEKAVNSIKELFENE